jgi:hypothetical protein
MGLLKAYNRQQRSRQQTVDSIKEGRKKSLSTTYRLLSTEKGIALVMILILAAIALAIMAGLIYMVTSSSQISGMQKRYETAREAGVGGADVAYQFIAVRGDQTDTPSFENIIKDLCPNDDPTKCITTSSSCTGTDGSGKSYPGGTSLRGLEAKLRTPSTSWSSACGPEDMSIIPGTPTSYDLNFDIGTSPYPTYRVYAKIVNTIEGNSGIDAGLLSKGVVSSGSGEVTVVSNPFLYTMEVDAENLANPSERSKLSILYQY